MGCITDRIHKGDDLPGNLSLPEQQDVFRGQHDIFGERSVPVEPTNLCIRTDMEFPEFTLGANTAYDVHFRCGEKIILYICHERGITGNDCGGTAPREFTDRGVLRGFQYDFLRQLQFAARARPRYLPAEFMSE